MWCVAAGEEEDSDELSDAQRNSCESFPSVIQNLRMRVRECEVTPKLIYKVDFL